MVKGNKRENLTIIRNAKKYITAKQTYIEKIKNFEQLYINQLENYVKIMKFLHSTTFHTGYKKKDRIKNKNKKTKYFTN